MKTRNAPVAVETNKVGPEVEFTIKQTGHVFKILSSSLYPNKPRAILREIATNARDAQVEAGMADVPFDVHLPNALEPTLVIRDYGVGLSEQQVKGLYTTYFESTKTDTNDQVGFLGLGSKSPFAYVDSFTIASYYNGVKTTYAAAINKHTVPTVRVMMRETLPKCGDGLATHNGLEITIPVLPNDAHAFAREAATVFTHFSPPPNVTGYPKFEIERIDAVLNGNGWKLKRVKPSRYSPRHYDDQPGMSAVAVQGCVAYPLNQRALGTLNQLERAILKTPFFIDFPIGQLDVAVSREELSYDKRTINNVRTRLREIAKELPDQFAKHFDKCTTLWEAKKLYGELLNEDRSAFAILSEVLETRRIKLKWRGHEIGDSNYSLDPKKFRSMTVFVFDDNYGYRQRYELVSANAAYPLSFDASDDTRIFIDDCGASSHKRIRRFRDENQEKYRKRQYDSERERRYLKTYLVRFVNDKGNAITDEAALKLHDDYNKFLACLGDGAPIRRVSELPKPEPQVQVNAERTKLFELSDAAAASFIVKRESWKPAEADFSAGGFYVILNRYAIREGERKVRNFGEMLKFATALGLLSPEDEPIFAVPATYKDKFVKAPQWVCVIKHIRESFAKKIEAENIEQRLANSRAVAKFDGENHRLRDAMPLLDTVAGALGQDSPLVGFVALYNHAQALRCGEDAIYLARCLNVKLTEHTAAFDLPAIWSATLARYPMLRYVVVGDTSRAKLTDPAQQALTAYVKMIDAMSGLPTG